MYRQSPSRNQRSKRIKVKYVLQICLLLAVCFWLIYQVKHSHDKKKEFEESESDAKDSLQKEKGHEIIDLGRKGTIHQRDYGTTSKNNKPIEEEETIEEDENKPEEDVPEEKNVDENLDDDEQENSDREEDSVDENETQEVDSEDGHGQESVSDENGDDKSTHEAREEHYKADDASSAVTHDTQTDVKENNAEETNTGDDGKDLEVENDEIGRDDQKSNVTTSETNVDVSDESENGSPPNKTVIEGPHHDLTSNSSAEVKIEDGDLSETKSRMDQDSRAISSERTNNSILNAELNSSDNYNAESVSTENITTLESSVVAGNKTESSIGTEKSDYENSESTVTENLAEEIQHDGTDVSDTFNSMEEKHVRMDLDTLPEIQTEGTNSEDDVAAE